MTASTSTSPTLTFSRTIQTSTSYVYTAFTSPDWLKRWFCDNTNIRPQVNGHVLFVWNTGFHATGCYTALNPNQEIAFTWRGTAERVDSQVTITLEDKDGQTHLTLEHRGLAPDAGFGEYETEWNTRLDNLKSVLETGEDLRITRRAYLGFSAGLLTKDKANQLGIPSGEGILVATIAEGFEDQGLQPQDVIVGIDDDSINTFVDYFAVISRHKPGETVNVLIYRDGEKKTVPFTLAAYPAPAVPTDLATLAEGYERVYGELDSTFMALVEGITDEEANQKPEPGEWNTKELLAHLILTEQSLQNWIGTLTEGPESLSFTALVESRIAGMVATYPEAATMVMAMRRSWAETVNLLKALPTDMEEHRNKLWWLNFRLDGMAQHGRDHLEQLKNTLVAIRS